MRIVGTRLQVASDIAEEISDFQIVDWHKLLDHPNLDIAMNALDIIKKSIKTFVNLKSFPEIMNALSRNVNHLNYIFRSCIYDVALLIYKENNLHAQAAKNILILGLVDQTEDNKNKVVNMWKENMNLPEPIADRFSYTLSKLYHRKIEDHFLGFANYFLIGLLNANDKFNELLFEHPLEDCDFEYYKLQINWRLQHPSVVPLFAETLQTFNPEWSQDENVFQLRKTQSSLDFAPTQNTLDETKTFTSLVSSFHVSSSSGDTSFKNPNSMNLSQKYRNRRRFLEDKSKISRAFAKHETEKKTLKIQKRVELAKEKERKVVIYRNYRKGDFPDIQIALSAVLIPLQMLAMVSMRTVCGHMLIVSTTSRPFSCKLRKKLPKQTLPRIKRHLMVS